ncbi:hypothetical protein [Pseudonocardia sp. ICBG601]|uniref:hypothetical protein n=1 Tax=Pseudonocardia sp. ICBG601 TaxID=2846759 RepID=UPI001CF654F9|nr:hypothetical protein [Pseudonocardia sp. ICBG601]
MRNLLRSAAGVDRLVPYEDAVLALGRRGDMLEYHDDVRVERIVGTVGRAEDFDAEFRLRNSDLRDRWDAVADLMARPGGPVARIDLLRLGEMYFVVDGHHRVSVARARGHAVIPARVRWVCTVAYALACLRVMHLPSKAAEREFLTRIPLPDPVRTELWLDRSADWMRLADAAEAWGFRESLRDAPLTDRRALAERWWEQEVVPLVRHLRRAGVGVGLRDIQLYAAATTTRDRRGEGSWPPLAGGDELRPAWAGGEGEPHRG